MSLSLISKLQTLIEEGESKKKIEVCEDVIAEENRNIRQSRNFLPTPDKQNY